MSETIKVMMTVTQRVTYSRIFEMPRSEFEAIDAELDSGPSWKREEAIAEKYMDFSRDWLDADDTEIQDFGEYKDEA